MSEAPPTIVLAVLGHARARGSLTPEEERDLVGRLLTDWALRSTLDLAELCAAAQGSRGNQLQNGRPRQPLQVAMVS
jgi:hypothetical protein